MLRDLRLASRRLLRQPGFTLLQVFILTVGLGATTAMFSLVNTAVLRPLPFPDSERLVRVQVGVRTKEAGYYFFQPFVFRHLRAHNDLFEGMAAVDFEHVGLAAPGQTPEPVWALEVTADFFPLLGVRPALGRVFLPDEDQPGRNGVVVLSHRLWVERFGGDPGVLGRTVQLGAQVVTVVGVMPAAFHGPLHRWTRADLWRPMGLDAAAMSPDAHTHLEVWARLKPGVTSTAAAAQLNALAAQLNDRRQRVAMVRALAGKSGLDEEMQMAAWLALGLAVFVLLIACTNLVGLQLARQAGRQHEQAIRLALGASRGRLVREAIAESLLVSVPASALSVLLAHWCTRRVGERLVLDDGPQLTIGVPAELDGRVLIFALAATLVSVVLVGTAPLWLGGRAALFNALRRGGHGTTGRARPRLRQGLVVAQMAMALVLLMGGGLFLRGLQRLQGGDPGWRVDGLMTGRVNLSGPRYAERSARAAFLDRLQQRLRGIPGVTGSAVAEWVPITGEYETRIEAEGIPPLPGRRTACVDAVSPEYFDVLGITLREGRLFHTSDASDGLPVAIVSAQMARDFWPGSSPLGKRIALATDAPGASEAYKAWRTVVGVVSDVRYPGGVESDPNPPYTVYLPIRQTLSRRITMALRTHGPPEALAGPLKAAVAELDPGLVLTEVMSARGMIAHELANFSLTGWVVLGFAAAGLLLSALGVYGLFAGLVIEQTREIGVRMALGAGRHQVLALVLRKGLQLAAAGALAGTLGGLALVLALRAVVHGLPAHEPAAVVVLALALVAVALFACWLPARRAAALDPMVALRHE